MITDISRNGFAMALPPYPFFAGAAVDCAGAFAGLACPAPGPVVEAISAVSLNVKVCNEVFFSSCLDSSISTFWKYPDRFIAVMKFATELIDALAPWIFRVLPFRERSVSQRFSVGETVFATM